MEEYQEQYYNEETKPESVVLYEEMLSNNNLSYFDISDYEEIIDYYINANSINQALDVCLFAEKQHPLSSSITLRKAQVLIEDGKPKQGLEILQEIAVIEPNNPEIFMLQGIALVHLGDVNKAIKFFEKVLNEVENTDDEVYILHDIAVTFMQLNQFSIALKYLNKAYRINPEDIALSYDIGYCLEKMDRDEESIKYFEKFLAEHPFSKITWYNLGVVYKKLKKYNKAIEAYDFSYAIDDEFSSPLYNKAYVLVKQKKYDEAIEVYSEFLKLEPENAAVYCFIGECYESLNNYDTAIEYYNKCLEIDQTFADAWYGLGILQVYQEKYQESITFLKNAIKYDSKNPGYWFTLAKVYNNLNNTKAAEILFKMTIKVEPYNPDFWLTYSEFKFSNKDLQSAINILIKAKEFISENAKIEYKLAAYLFSSGNNSVAYKHLKNALKQDYNSHNLFLEYYPEGKINQKIKKIIDSYTEKK